MDQFDFLNDGQSEDSTEMDQELSEAERRFEKAQYYRVLLKESFFDNDTAEAVEVVEEIRKFIRYQMGVLLGVKQHLTPKVESVFSDEEVLVLKQLTSKFLKKPQLMEAPQVRQAHSEPAPSLRKQEPTLKKATPKPVQAKERTKKQIQTKETSNGVLQFDEETGQIANVTQSATGERLVQNMTPQARPVGAIQPVPPLNEQSMAIIAAQHEAKSKQGVTSKILELSNNS